MNKMRWNFILNRERFQDLYDACENIHRTLSEQGKGHRGHGFDHDLTVAQLTTMICNYPREAACAWVAALLHSMDRLHGSESDGVVKGLLALVKNQFSPEELNDILEAVKTHAGPNMEDDSYVKMVLQDADRLANVMPLVIARSGQFNATIPVIELGFLGNGRHPESTYKEPRSVKDDLIGCLEWEDSPKFGLRLSNAKKLGAKYFAFLRTWFAIVKADYEELGLDPWPIENR